MTQELAYTPEVARATAAVHAMLADQYEEKHWQTLAPYIYEINRLKKEKFGSL